MTKGLADRRAAGGIPADAGHAVLVLLDGLGGRQDIGMGLTGFAEAVLLEYVLAISEDLRVRLQRNAELVDRRTGRRSRRCRESPLPSKRVLSRSAD